VKHRYVRELSLAVVSAFDGLNSEKLGAYQLKEL